MSSPICLIKNNIFQIHHNRKVKNAKTGETIFQDTEKQDKTRKIHLKHVQQIKETDKIVFLGEKTEKESLTEVYKDSEKCEERLSIEKTKGHPRPMKNSKGRKKTERNGKTRRDQKKRTSG